MQDILHHGYEQSFCQAFGEHFRRIRQIFQLVGKFFEVFDRVQTRLDLFRPAGMHSEALGCIWTVLDSTKFGNFEFFESFFGVLDVLAFRMVFGRRRRSVGRSVGCHQHTGTKLVTPDNIFDGRFCLLLGF